MKRPSRRKVAALNLTYEHIPPLTLQPLLEGCNNTAKNIPVNYCVWENGLMAESLLEDLYRRVGRSLHQPESESFDVLLFIRSAIDSSLNVSSVGWQGE